MQHSSRLSPVIHIFMFRGQPVEVCRACGGTYDEAAGALVDTMLPQNNAILKVGKHAIAEDTGCRLPAVVAGQPGVLRDSVGGGEAGQ